MAFVWVYSPGTAAFCEVVLAAVFFIMLYLDFCTIETATGAAHSIILPRSCSEQSN